VNDEQLNIVLGLCVYLKVSGSPPKGQAGVDCLGTRLAVRNIGPGASQ